MTFWHSGTCEGRLPIPWNPALWLQHMFDIAVCVFFFWFVCFSVFCKDCCVNLKVENTSGQPVYFMYYTPLHWLRDMILKDEHKVTRANPLCLKSGNTQIISDMHRQTMYGHHFKNKQTKL